MPGLSLEERVTALEAEVRRLKHERAKTPKEEQPWWDRIFGAFANDPMFDEAMRLGEEYRRSQRPDYDDGSDNADVPA